jgi:hypothetical protein
MLDFASIEHLTSALSIGNVFNPSQCFYSPTKQVQPHQPASATSTKTLKPFLDGNYYAKIL